MGFWRVVQGFYKDMGFSGFGLEAYRGISVRSPHVRILSYSIIYPVFIGRLLLFKVFD